MTFNDTENCMEITLKYRKGDRCVCGMPDCRYAYVRLC